MMKWASFISCLFLLSLAESKSLSRKNRDAGLEGTTSHFATSPLTEFDSLALAWFSQYVQQATYEEVEKLVNGVRARSTNCATYGLPDPRCADSVHADFLNELCHAQDIVAKYKLTECCAKADPERHECFVAHKNATPGFIPPFQVPDAEDICRAPQNVIIAQSIYETARRYPDAAITTILIAVNAFQKVLPVCCQEEDKNTCFKEKDGAITKKFEEDHFLQQYTCLILKKNGRKELKDLNLAQLSQQHPQAEYSVVDTLAELLTRAHEECCRSASFQCFQRKVDVSNLVCEHNDTTSTKVVECLSKFESGSPRAELLPADTEVIDNREACQRYAESHTGYLAEFLYKYSKRHPEFSVQLLLQTDEKYEALLDQCCKTEDAPGCLAQLDEQVNKHIADSLEAIEPYCASAKQGDYIFQNLQLLKYTQRAPQLSFDDLYKYTKKLAAVGAKCCPLNGIQRLACVDQSVDHVLGAICLQEQTHPINQQIHRCCNDHFHNRRQCFLSLGKDESYTPVPHKWTSVVVCSTDSVELELKKQRFLVDLVRHRPDLTESQVHDVLTHFSDAVEKCCQVEDHKECFEKEYLQFDRLHNPQCKRTSMLEILNTCSSALILDYLSQKSSASVA